MSRFVIPAGQEALLLRMLDVGGPWSLRGVVVDRDRVRADYSLDTGTDCALWLHHPSASLDGRAHTDCFSVSADVEPPPELVEAVLVGVRAAEAAFTWVLASDPAGDGRDPVRDVELVALLAGLKPAMRISVALDAAEAVEARCGRRNLVTERLSHPRLDAFGAGRGHVLVCVARDRDTARALCEQERRLLSSDRNDTSRDAAKTLGRLLGYPDCCVEAHLTRIRSVEPGSSYPYRAAHDAWVQAPRHWLNNLLAGEGAQLITFEPCAYDCGRAVELARAVARALDGHQQGAAGAIESRLARDLVIGPTGARARVEWSRGRIERAEVVRRLIEPALRATGDDESVEPRETHAADTTEVARWVGLAVGNEGWLDSQDPRPLLLRFGAGST